MLQSLNSGGFTIINFLYFSSIDFLNTSMCKQFEFLCTGFRNENRGVIGSKSDKGHNNIELNFSYATHVQI
jgi:hypothetical protein